MYHMIHGAHLWIRKGLSQKLPQCNWAKGSTLACMDPCNSQVKNSPEPFDFKKESDLIQLTWTPYLYPHLNCQVKQFFCKKFLYSLERGRCQLSCLQEDNCFPRSRQLGLLELFCPWNLQGPLPLPRVYPALFRNLLKHRWDNNPKSLYHSVPETSKLSHLSDVFNSAYFCIEGTVTF